jgi:hypothetical protein
MQGDVWASSIISRKTLARTSESDEIIGSCQPPASQAPLALHLGTQTGELNAGLRHVLNVIFFQGSTSAHESPSNRFEIAYLLL